MTFEYTPDDQDIQDNYAVGRAGGDLGLSLAEMRAEYGPEFDQWLSAHDARVRAEALRDAADRYFYDGVHDQPLHGYALLHHTADEHQEADQ